MPSAPDIQGFVTAQARLRETTGVDAVFHVPQAPTWDPDEPIDPETGRPYDPFAQPTAGGDDVDEIVRCGLVGAMVTGSVPRDDVSRPAIGPIASDDVALDMDPADYLRVQEAREVTILGHRYRVQEMRPDGLADTITRYFVYAQRL